MSASSSMIGGHSSFQFQASIDHAATAYIESLMDMDEQRKRGITTSYKTEEVDSQHLPPLKKLKSSHDVVNNSTSSTSTEVTPLMSNNSAELAAAQLSLSRTQPSSSTARLNSQHTNTVHAVASSSSKTPPSSSSSMGYFILPEDFECLTDYHVLLFAQTKSGKMTQSDITKTNRLNSAHCVGYPGLRCAHCGGNERGSYFPTTMRNLNGSTPTLHAHVVSCRHVPSTVLRALKTAKIRHKQQVMTKPSGGITVFFTKLWERIHSESFNGAGGSDLQIVVDKLNSIVEYHSVVVARTQADTLPNVVSYDDQDGVKQHAYLPTLAAGVGVGQGNTQMTHQEVAAESFVNDEDFETALDLLRLSPDNCTATFDNTPDVDIDPAPVNAVNNQWTAMASPEQQWNHMSYYGGDQYYNYNHGGLSSLSLAFGGMSGYYDQQLNLPGPDFLQQQHVAAMQPRPPPPSRVQRPRKKKQTPRKKRGKLSKKEQEANKTRKWTR